MLERMQADLVGLVGEASDLDEEILELRRKVSVVPELEDTDASDGSTPRAVTAGCVILVGFSLVMVSLPGLVRLLMFGSLTSCFFSLVTLLGRTLPLRCCTSRFAHKVPTWSLPVSGGVALLVSSGHGGGILVRSDPSSPDPGRIGDRCGVPRSGFKRVRLRRKTLVHEVFRAPIGDHSRPRVWKRLKLGVSFGEDDDAGRKQLHGHLDSGGPVHDRTGIG